MKQKIFTNLDAAVADVPDGARIMFGGFGGAGFPNNLIQALARKGTKDITAISNNCGTREGLMRPQWMPTEDRVDESYGSGAAARGFMYRTQIWLSSWCSREPNLYTVPYCVAYLDVHLRTATRANEGSAP